MKEGSYRKTAYVKKNSTQPKVARFIETESEWWLSGTGSAGKELPASARDVRDTGLILGWEDHLEESMATHSSILACSIPTDRGASEAT